MVARMLVGCGVPSGCITSLSTMYPSLRAASGYRATGFRIQSDLCPSACIVELPSNPHKGRSPSVGGAANSLSVVLPRNSGMGFLPSSQIYSNLYFFIVVIQHAPLIWALWTVLREGANLPADRPEIQCKKSIEPII